LNYVFNLSNPLFNATRAACARLGCFIFSRDFRSWFTHRRRRRQLIALIITGKAEKVSKRILADLGCGVTALEGKGMYTGLERSVLICALTVTKAHNLKVTVAKAAPQAFVVVSPAQVILGCSFNPLEEE